MNRERLGKREKWKEEVCLTEFLVGNLSCWPGERPVRNCQEHSVEDKSTPAGVGAESEQTIVWLCCSTLLFKRDIACSCIEVLNRTNEIWCARKGCECACKRGCETDRPKTSESG
jgi:hypothetical protein